jgi:hypothetical protein
MIEPISQKSLEDYDSLGFKDTLGYGYEMDNLNGLKSRGLHAFIKYHNPTDPHKWKRTKGHGPDLELQVPNQSGYVYHIHIEESFCSRSYCYRRKWFLDCRVKRFENKPHDRFNIWIVLTNQVSNFNTIGDLANEQHIKIFDFNTLVGYINRLFHISFKPKATPSSLNLLSLSNYLTNINYDTILDNTLDISKISKYVYAYDTNDIDNAILDAQVTDRVDRYVIDHNKG